MKKLFKKKWFIVLLIILLSIAVFFAIGSLAAQLNNNYIAMQVNNKQAVPSQITDIDLIYNL